VAHYQHAPQHTVKIHHFDPELAVMVMEDLRSPYLARRAD
jgi:5-methylthioribose kinase